jgi:signal transduction histidine kinase
LPVSSKSGLPDYGFLSAISQRYQKPLTGEPSMRLNDASSQSARTTRQTSDRDRISISRLINEIVLSLSDHFTSSRITVELDVQSLEVHANGPLIRDALKGLMQNALQSMQRGGELSVTLIDCPHQWEVADTSTNRLVEASILKDQPSPAIHPSEQPETIGMARDATGSDCESLSVVYAAAEAHGGHVQTWNCPSGGTANVLIIPKLHRNAA